MTQTGRRTPRRTLRPVPEFLSDRWLRELDDAVRAAADLRALGPVVIEQLVHDVPGRGDVRYQLRIADAVARIETRDLGPADVRISLTYREAVAIARGEQNAQNALARGDLRIGGNVEVLTSRAATLSALDDATATLRAATTFPEP
jgi:hypothetical protein